MSTRLATWPPFPGLIVLFTAGVMLGGLSYWAMHLLPDVAQGAGLSPWHYLQAAQFGLGVLLAGCWLGQSRKARQQLRAAAQENKRLQLAAHDSTLTPQRLAPSHTRSQQGMKQPRSQFLSTLNHELRTPMNAVLGMTHLLRDTPLTPEQAKLAQGISESGDALMVIIKDLLDFAEIETGTLKIDSRPFDLRDVIESCAAVIAPKARAKNLMLHCTLGPSFPETWIGDGARIHQIVLNLMDNAVKFTNSGSVALSVHQLGANAASACLRVEVCDTGIGIELADVEQLFQPFTQADGSDGRRHGGMGLGLLICQQLVQMMHGSIGFTHAQPQGSRFWVELPMASGSAN